MLDSLVSATAAAILATIRTLGYAGIITLMAAESACIPIPSEIIMTFSGYLVSVKALSFIGVTLAGTLGSVAGSLAAYALGAYGGLPFLQRHGRAVLISPRDLDRAHAWFLRYGQAAVFVGRLLPVLRTFISVPAGVARMPLAPFVAYSAAGSLIWCAGLTWVGLRLGLHWRVIGPYLHPIDEAIVAGVAIFLGLGVRRHWLRRRADRSSTRLATDRQDAANDSDSGR